MFVYDLKPWRVKLNLQNEKKSSIFLFRKFLARNLQTNYLFKAVSKRYFSHRFILGERGKGVGPGGNWEVGFY